MKLAKRGSHGAKNRIKKPHIFALQTQSTRNAPLAMNTSPAYTITQIHYFYIYHSKWEYKE